MKLEEMKALCEAATPGPWSWQPPMNQWDHCTIRLENGGNILNTTSYGLMRNDAAFVATARTLMPRLIETAAQAKHFRSVVFDRIAHGDDAHRTWLKTELEFMFGPFDREMAALESD